MVVGYDMAFPVGKAYNICPQYLGLFFEGLDTMKRLRPFFEFELVLSVHLWRN